MLIQDIPSDSLTRRLRGAGVQLHTGAFATRIWAESATLAEQIAFMYAHHPYREDEPDIDDFRIKIAAPSLWRRWFRPQAQIYIDGQTPFEPLEGHLGFPLMESSLNWSAALGIYRYLILHAAVVERDGVGIVMPAPAGSGKSTLCAALASQGWRLFSDEFALIKHDDGRLLPNPRPISLKNEAIDVIADRAPKACFSPRFDGTIKGTMCFLRPKREDVERMEEDCRLGFVVMPRFERGAETRMETVDRIEAFLALTDNAVNYAGCQKLGFDGLTRVVEERPVYRLFHSDLDQAISLIETAHAQACEAAEAA